MFIGSVRRVDDVINVQVIDCRYTEGEIVRQVFVHAPDAERGTAFARRLADAPHAAAAEVDWRDGVDNCGHCDAAGPQRWRNAPQSQVAVASIAAIIVASSSGSEPAYG
jgi:hypothetical protein